MTKYIPHRLHLTNAQKAKIRKMQSVQIRGSHLGDGSRGSTVLLTRSQINRIQRRRMSKGKPKGVRLIFSADQLRHNYRQGSGIFDSLKSGAQKLLELADRTGIKDKVISGAEDLGKQALNKGFDLALNKLKGKGIVAPGGGIYAPGQNGSGIFDVLF